MDKAKPFCIAKRDVWQAYKRVKANRGAAGVDGESIASFDSDLKNNLYRLWNRMSSGSYFPPAVRRVEIPKERWEDEAAWHTDGLGSHRPDSGSAVSGADIGTCVPCGLLWIPSRQIGIRCTGCGAAAMLAA